jgi:hypothetical protein
LSTGKLRAESITLSPHEHRRGRGFVINSGWNGALPSAAMNVVWIGIGVYALQQRKPRARRTPGGALGASATRAVVPHRRNGAGS